VDEASFDRYSVKLTTCAEGGIGLWLRQAPVTPGAHYRLEFDVKTAEGNVPVRMRVVVSGKTLASGGLTANSRVWGKGDVSFRVPDGKETVSLYFNVGKGEPDLTLYVDNIVLTRLDSAPVANP